MNVTKIKIKQDRVSIDYDKMVIVDDNELVNKYSIDSPEHPTGAFKDAFQKMDFFLIELCELCDKQDEIPIMCEDVSITGLSFKYKDGELSGAVITGTKALAYSNSPLVLNTPNKSVDINSEFNKMAHLTYPCIASLKSVIEHAKEYVEGKRLQVEMDLKDEITQVEAKKPEPEKFDSHKPKEVDPNAGKGDETVQPKDDVSRETVKTAAVVPKDEWLLHPHNPDSPNFIGDAAIHQLDDIDEADDSYGETELPSVPDIED